MKGEGETNYLEPVACWVSAVHTTEELAVGGGMEKKIKGGGKWDVKAKGGGEKKSTG